MLLTILLAILTGACCDSTAADLYNKARYSEAISMAEKGIEISAKEGDEESRLGCMSTLSATYVRLGDFGKALEYALEIYAADEKTGNPEDLSYDLHSMAVINHLSGNTESAIEYIVRSIEYARQAGDSYRSYLAVRLGNAAEIFRNVGRAEEATRLAREAYEIDLADGREKKVPVRQCQLAGCLAASGETGKAIGLYRESIEKFREYGNKESLSIGCRELANLLPEGSGEAVALLEEAYATSKETGNQKSLLECCKALSDRYSKRDPAKALAFMEEALTLKDEIDRKSNSEQAERFNAQFKVKEQAFMLQKEKAKARYSLIGALLLTVIVLIMVAFLRNISISRKALMESNKEAKEHLRSALEQIDNLKAGNSISVDLPNFTKRELDIMRLASQGKIGKEIAEALGISSKTVDNIKSGIFQKIGVNTTLEMVIFAIRNKIV